MLAEVVCGFVAGNGEQPGGEMPTPKAVKSFKSRQESLGGHIFGFLLVTKSAVQIAEHPRNIQLVQLAKGPRVLPGNLDEPLLFGEVSCLDDWFHSTFHHLCPFTFLHVLQGRCLALQ